MSRTLSSLSMVEILLLNVEAVDLLVVLLLTGWLVLTQNPLRQVCRQFLGSDLPRNVQ